MKADSYQATIGPYIVFCAATAALGTFNAGINTASLNIPEAVIRYCSQATLDQYASSSLPACLPMSDWVWGAAVGMYPCGGLLGGITANNLSDRFGRRSTLIGLNLFYFIGGLLISTATTTVQFAIGRVFVGIAAGIATVVTSVYIAELSPPKYRGGLGVLLQLEMTIGIFIAECLGLGLSTVRGWRWMTAVTVVPGIIQMILLFFCVESPRWLIGQNRIEEATVALTRVRQGYNIDRELAAMIAGQQDDHPQPSAEAANSDISLSDSNTVIDASALEENPIPKKYMAIAPLNIYQLLSTPLFLKLTLKLAVIHAGSQLSGMNGVMYYSTSIFQASFGDNAKYATVGVGALNVVITILSLGLVDRLGRKALLLISEFGMCIFSVVMVIASVYHVNGLVVAAVLLFVTFFAVGLGTVCWLLTAEMFPTFAVGAASSLCIGINWLFNFVIGLIFPSLNNGLGNYTFVLFAAIGGAHGIYTLFLLPETKGKTIEEIGLQLGWAKPELLAKLPEGYELE
ncbi:hypothetical protein BZG36_04309 [Bifiguratus adelaidae]|uniref:Major facilitator superfamily (MFS) profile domain-containing protein n=1 Tax=Bifiguratus adelaidae TaxID=1938954 RepID=A0A261XZR0_9FUNG|nr:hypothetical protein BZG36_04309 [Bifiguratus adelaidae]